MPLIVANQLLSVISPSDVIDALSTGGIGAFFVLMFILFYFVYKIIVQVSKNPDITIPRSFIIVVSAALALIFSSFAFILLLSDKGSRDGGKQSSTLPGYDKKTSMLYASINIDEAPCAARDVSHKLTFNGSQPFYVLINANGPDVLPNQLALLSIADDFKSATFRIGNDQPFIAKLNTPASVSGGGCSYTLTLTDVSTENEGVLFKRKYAHYKLTPFL